MLFWNAVPSKALAVQSEVDYVDHLSAGLLRFGLAHSVLVIC
jgi:hypothetical protein